MQKTIETLRCMSDEEITQGLNNFIDNNSVAVALSKECRDYLSIRGIYGPYKKFEYESL